MTFKYAEIEDALVSFIEKNVSGKDVGVAFSGGLDSGLVSAISKEYAESVTFYTCGTKSAYDVMMAKDLAKRLDLPWVHAPISKATVEGLLREFISATGTSDPFTLSYELPLFCVCRTCGQETVVSGQGADEYFMGCAKFVGQEDGYYDTLAEASVDRLLKVSVPCERQIASHFGKELVYPYIDDSVTSEVLKLDPEELRPKDMDSRKAVLKEIAVHLGYDVLATRKKKSSQYGSGTTDVVRALAKEKRMMYNQYIAYLYDDVTGGSASKGRGSVINARIDSVVKVNAENILSQNGLSPSEAIEAFYRKVVEEKGVRFLE